jgi:hypothetical protein
MANENYKRWHVPKQNHFNESGNLKKGETHQGYLHNKYKMLHPEKYIGDVSLIIYRSGWELSFCKWCDASPSVIRWSSEPVKVPYYDRVSKLAECQKYGLDPNNPSNWLIKYYNTDFWIEIGDDKGEVKKMFIEIKPSDKLIKPTPPAANSSLKEKKNFNIRAKEYLINEAKFAAMNAWAEKTGVKFYVFTEKTLSKLIGNF